jgi:glycosyltransferase involved in cell wall biosynthesis
MVLGVDISRLVGPRTGVGRYLEYLLREWATMDLPFERVRLFSPTDVPDVPEDPRFELEVLPSRRSGGLWQATKLRRSANGHLDAFFAPYVLPPGFRGRAVVATLGVLEGAHAHRTLRARIHSLHYAYSARRADVVLVHSANTRDDVVRHYGVPPGRVEVVHVGTEDRFHPARGGEEAEALALVERLTGTRSDYVLFVGKLSPRRNVPALVEAFVHGRPDLQLLLVGPNTGTPDLAERVSRLGLDRRVCHVDHLGQDDLALLYRGARMFVLPTEQEGFSATILEALASGCPVLTLEHDALSEGDIRDAVLVVDRADAATLARGLAQLDGDEALRARLRAAGLRAAAGFSFAETARRTMDVLARVATSGAPR